LKKSALFYAKEELIFDSLACKLKLLSTNSVDHKLYENEYGKGMFVTIGESLAEV
jgi:hypothetical protein